VKCILLVFPAPELRWNPARNLSSSNLPSLSSGIVGICAHTDLHFRWWDDRPFSSSYASRLHYLSRHPRGSGRCGTFRCPTALDVRGDLAENLRVPHRAPEARTACLASFRELVDRPHYDRHLLEVIMSIDCSDTIRTFKYSIADRVQSRLDSQSARLTPL
jgi:hypothetical protein